VEVAGTQWKIRKTAAQTQNIRYLPPGSNTGVKTMKAVLRHFEVVGAGSPAEPSAAAGPAPGGGIVNAILGSFAVPFFGGGAPP